MPISYIVETFREIPFVVEEEMEKNNIDKEIEFKIKRVYLSEVDHN